jgi:hypothetical protein
VRAAPAASSSSASPALFTAVTVNIELRIRKNEGSGSCYISAECMMCMPTTSRMLLTESREFAITRSELIERLHGFALSGNRCDEVGRSRCNVDQLADEHGVGSRYN